MKFLISHGHAIRSVFGRSLVTHFMPAPPSVEIDVDEQGRETADGRSLREAPATRSAQRAEAEQQRCERSCEDTRSGVLVANREDDARSIREEVAARASEDQIPEQRGKGCRDTGDDDHHEPSLPKNQ